LKRIKSLLELFFSMLKIGLFTFGGGYAMIHILEGEFVGRKGWISGDEFMDLVTIAESTPGPIAINCATYIGHKKDGVLGSLFATLGMCLPSFTIIFLISLFFDSFLKISWVASAFRGIQMCVIYLIFAAGLRMLKKIKKTLFNITVMGITVICLITFSLLSVSFSTIFYILIFGAVGLFLYSVGEIKKRRRSEEEKP
jgi:chromate transporter